MRSQYRWRNRKLSVPHFVFGVDRTGGGYNSSKFWQTLSRLGSLTLYVLMIHVAEDDILRWGQIVEAVGARSQGLAWLGVLVVRILADVCIAVLLQRCIQFLMSKAQAVK